MANNISDLYNQVINEHRKYPRNKGLIEGYKTLKVKNPSCGDDVTVQLDIKDGIIQDVRHIGTGCADSSGAAWYVCDGCFAPTSCNQLCI